MHFYQILEKAEPYYIYVDDVLLGYNPLDIEEINVLKRNLLNPFRGND